MKSKVISGAALAAAAISLALGGAVAPAAAHSAGHTCTMAKGKCGGKMKCMTKSGVCRHHMHSHKGGCHHSKSHCASK